LEERRPYKAKVAGPRPAAPTVRLSARALAGGKPIRRQTQFWAQPRWPAKLGTWWRNGDPVANRVVRQPLSSSNPAGNQVVQLPPVRSQWVGGETPCRRAKPTKTGKGPQSPAKPDKAAVSTMSAFSKLSAFANLVPAVPMPRAKRVGDKPGPTGRQTTATIPSTLTGARQTFPPQRAVANRGPQTTYPQTPACLWIPQRTNRFSVRQQQLHRSSRCEREKSPTPAPGITKYEETGAPSSTRHFRRASYAWFAQHPAWREASSRSSASLVRIL
jgi:hypothetical protein